MTPGTFRYTHRVTYAQCTVGNHVYYARYLDILEAARGEFLRELGMPLGTLQEQDTIFPVIGIELSYKAPARYDDTLSVDLWLAQADGVRLNVGARVVNQNGAVILEGETRHVCTTLGEKPKRIPKELLEKLQPFKR